MKTAQKQTKGINLLPQEEFSASTLGRILAWLLSTFRIIVIVTELVVMGVFLSRFWLDAKANDLNESLRANQAILSTTTEFENEFKNIQTKLETFSKVSKLNTGSLKYIDKISQNLPLDVYLTSIQITKDFIQLKGNSINEIAISQFLKNLNNISLFQKVTLLGINSNQQNNYLIEFSIKIEINEKGEK